MLTNSKILLSRLRAKLILKNYGNFINISKKKFKYCKV